MGEGGGAGFFGGDAQHPRAGGRRAPARPGQRALSAFAGSLVSFAALAKTRWPGFPRYAPSGAHCMNTVLSKAKTGSSRWFTPVFRENAMPQPGREPEARLSVRRVAKRIVSPA